jgi:hypothetical protein
MAVLLDQLGEADFSEQVALMTSSVDANRQAIPLSPETTSIPVAQMSQGEKQLAFGTVGHVEGWGIASFNLCHLQNYCYNFSTEVGHWPQDGKELLAWVWANDADKVKEILALPRDKQFIASGLLYFINPVTGRLYDSFQAETWTPGGVNFKQLHTRDEVYEAFGDRLGADRMGLPSYLGTWLIEVWGEQPGVKLGSLAVNVEDPNLFHLNPPLPETARP